MSHFGIDLTRYPNLKQLHDYDLESFGKKVAPFMKLLDHLVLAEAFERSEKELGVPLTTLIQALVESFLDWEGIVSKHRNKAEQEALQVLEAENNPLTIFTKDAMACSASGERMSKDEFLGHDHFNIKDWLQGLLYGARYLPHEEIVNYMQIGKYELVDKVKDKNLIRRLQVAPAINYQLINDLVPFKFLSGKGYLDCGEIENTDECPACASEITFDGKHYVCITCKGGFLL